MGKLKMLPKLEFKGRDCAWYDVSIQLTGSQLKVKYEGFPEDHYDEVLTFKDFKTPEDVGLRFRLRSKQLQDHHCSELKDTTGICASSSSDDRDNRFFDAIVEQVYRAEHKLVDGEDQCTCAFMVLWLEGPNADKRTIISCYNIFLLTAGSIETHPVINDFVKLVEKMVYSDKRSYLFRNTCERKRKITDGRGLHLKLQESAKEGARNSLLPENSDEADAKTLITTVSQKKQKPNLHCLNSLPVECEELPASLGVSVLPKRFRTSGGELGVSNPCSRIKTATDGSNISIDGIGNKANPATSQVCNKVDNTVGNLQKVRPAGSGSLEAAEYCDNLIKESSDCNVEGVHFYASEVLVLDNLEKDVSPFDVIRIITDMASLIVQVAILPGLKSQSFTRGFVWFKDRASLMKVYALFQDENFFIVSANGRPWVAFITEREEDGIAQGTLVLATVNSYSQGPKPLSQRLGAQKILFVPKGTTEYEKAKAMKYKFLERFGNLHKRFECEESTD